MPIVPSFIERTVLLGLNQGPGMMLDQLGGAVFRAAGAALRLGIFEALADGPLEAAEVARRVGANEGATGVLLELLATTGYLKKSGGRFRNTAMTSRWLLRGSPDNMIEFVELWQGVLYDLWDGIEETVRTGRPARSFTEWLSKKPDGWKRFNAAMAATARSSADEIAEKAGLAPEARKLLDVGGNHGVHSAAFCRRIPTLTATIFDAPEALASARELLSAHALGPRLVEKPGDILTDDPGEGYDAVLAVNVLHYFPPAECLKVVRKLAGALKPRGLLIIGEQLAGGMPGRTLEAYARMLSLNYLHALGGQIYSFGELTGWMTAAGLGVPKLIKLKRAAGIQLVVAARP